MQAQKKQPIRKCSGCGERFPKNELIRVLRTPEGEITLDSTGKKNGRGAYLCKSAACLKKARKSKRIDMALECKIPEEVYDRLEEDITRE
ncbi:MAG: YlxR family protein [Clostridia bacterium]|nr:YlxR family protein [Clostridia bacterium]